MGVREPDSNSFISSSPQSSSKSWRERTFSKMGAGSVRGSIFTLASTAMGAGYLATPTILLNAGVLLGLAIIVLCGLLVYMSLIVVAKCADKYKIYHYPSVAREMLGNRWAVLLELAIIFNGYGLIVALNIIIGSLIPDILSSFTYHGNGVLVRDLAMVCLNALIVTPLGLMRNLGALRFKAMFNVTCLTFIMLVVIIEFPFFAEDRDYGELKYFVVDINFFNAFSLGLFAYLCHQNITRIQGELVDNNMRRTEKVTLRSVMVMCTLFCTLALFGYLSCLNSTPALVILRRPPSTIANDWAMVMCRIMITFTMSITIPINLNPCRVSVLKLFFKTEGRASTLLHGGVTMGIIISTLILAIFFPNIKIVFNFLGGVCGSIMALIIPGLMFVKLSGLPATQWKNLTVIVVSWVLAIIGFTSLGIDIYDET